MALELINAKVDVLSAVGAMAALVAKQVAGAIPVLFTAVPDPVGLGLVASLARPGGNITGTTFDVKPAIFGKHVELLKEISPRLSRHAVFINPASSGDNTRYEHILAAARALGIKVQSLSVADSIDYDAAFAAILKERADGILVIGRELHVIHRNRITAFAAQNTIPAIYGTFLHAEAGGLITYLPDAVDGSRRSAAQLAMILNGIKPRDIAVEQLTQFRLVVNLKTAKALGLTVPKSLLLRADAVIE